MSIHSQTSTFQSSCTNTSCCPPQAPVRNANRKVGRNDPCPCGSTKNTKNVAAIEIKLSYIESFIYF